VEYGRELIPLTREKVDALSAADKRSV